jgi:hypothetical protein
VGRHHKDVVVVAAFNADGQTVREDIVPRHSFEIVGSLLLNSAALRKANEIRMISVREFDEHGVKLNSEMKYFDYDGEPIKGMLRRVDGTIIDDPYI